MKGNYSTMKLNKDTLGDRVKRYESVSKLLLTRRTPVIVRVDGKAFHTFTRGCNKPYDKDILKSMVYAANQTAKQMQGFKLAYIQSDEASFLLTDYDTLETGAWFDYELSKIVSITASLFTAYFNKYWQQTLSNKRGVGVNEIQRIKHLQKVALFDARAFNVPQDDWQNVFIWRQRDWERNSIQMLARSLFSYKELHGENTAGLHQLIQGAGKDWNELEDVFKYGAFIKPDHTAYFGRVDYNKLTELAGL